MEHLRDLVIEGEPKVVTDARKLIIDSFSDLHFDPEPHIYTFPDGRTLPSVSAIIHQFEPHKDFDIIAQRYAEKNGHTAEYWQLKWKHNNLMSTTTGSLVHEFGESLGWLWNGHPENITQDCKSKYDKEHQWLIPTRSKEEAILKFHKEMHKDLHLVLPETKVYTGKFASNSLVAPHTLKQEYCGTFDILYYYDCKKDPSKSGFVLMDYKGLPLDYPILTTTGWKTMGTLTVTDLVYDKDGNPSKILHISSIHNNECYEITLDNGEKITCDKDHRWEINFVHNKGRIITKVLTPPEIKEYLLKYRKSGDKRKLPKIRVSNAIQNPKKQLPIDPYVLGVWLGDGNRCDSHITQANNGVWEEIKKRGYELGENVSSGNTGKALTRNVNGIRKHLIDLNLIKNKHIPEIYLTSSYDQRVELLQGLMDSDGYYNNSRKQFCMNTGQEKQADYLCELLSTLGIKATKIYHKAIFNKGKKKFYDAWYVTFKTIKLDPFLVRSKAYTITETSQMKWFNIKEVKITSTIPTRCIEVDSPSHTYLCGKHLIITHNTNKELHKSYSREHNRTILAPFNHLYDEPFSLYTLQLSAYQIPLENIGLKVIARRIIWLKDDGTYEVIPTQNYTTTLRQIL